MKKRIIALVLTVAMLVSALPLTAFAARATAVIVEAALQLLYYNEGSYGSVNPNDNGAVSIGKIQWHGNRALNLLKTIVNKNHGQAQSILGGALYNEILTATDWSRRTVNNSEKNAISALLVTDDGKAAQDALATQDVTVYVVHGQNLGIADDAALVYFADLENQGGAGMSRRVAGAAATTMGSYANVNLQALHNAALADSVAGKYATRRNRTFTYCQNLGWDQPTPYADLGADFYAPILNKEHWKIIENNNGVVQTGDENGTASQLWRFERQGDGSYKISSCQDGRCLDVANASSASGAEVWLVESNDTDAQRWYIYEEAGGYVLKAKCTECVLDLPNNDPSNGNRLQMYTKNGTGAQIWAIYRGEECQLNGPTLSVQAGNSSTATKFTWNNVYGERNYDLKIWKDTLWQGDAYHIEWSASSGCEIVLPEGTYHAYVDAVNHYECKMGNVVTFTVAANTQPKIQWWMSDSEYGDTVSDFKVGNRYYFCYRIYDGVSGKDWDEVADYDYSVRLTIYNPDGSVCYSNTDYDDTSWISVFYREPGTYTREVVLEGDFSFSGSRTFTVAENPKQIHASTDRLHLTMGETESAEIYAWTSGYHNVDCVLSWSVSNDNISCSWGEWTDGKAPLTVTAHSGGNSTITLSVKEKESQTVLHSVTVDVTVDANEYTICYDANGGSGAPGDQIKPRGTAVSLSSTVPNRFGYNFGGWATSSNATTATYQPGDSFSTDADTTLYAVWQSPDSISSNVTSSSYSAAVPYANDCRYFVFTPSFTGKVQFESSNSGDPQLYLYDASGNQIASDDDSGEGRNFLLTYSVTAGTKYYVKVRHYSSGTGNISFTVKRAYDIVYDANGGSGAPGSQTKLHGTDLTLSSATPTLDGYIFQGWTTSQYDPYATYQPGDSFTVDADTTLYAVWALDSHTVRYDANGGSGAPGSQSKISGTDLILSGTVPTRFAYNFKGWATSATAATADYQPGDTFSTDADTTLYAVWEAAQLWSMESYSREVVYPGVGFYIRIEPERSVMHELWCNGYKYVMSHFGMPSMMIYETRTTLYNAAGDQLAQCVNPGLSSVMLYHPLTAGNVYYAYIELTDPDAAGTIELIVTGASTIRYDANGGSGAPDPQYCYRSEETLSAAVPTRSGYTFLGWATSATAVEAEYQPGDSFYTESDITLFAVWASESLPSGSCGPDVTWTLANNGVLTISGSGPMTDYEYKSEMPWYSHRDRITSVVIENGVTSIGSFAFYGMDIESIEIPQTVTVIGDFAFKNAAKLDGVVLPDNLSKLGESAFYACTSLTSIDIPAKLYTIKPYTFKNCTALENVTFHEGNLQKISDGAFYNTALTSVELPDCLDILDAYVFKNCSELASVQLSSGLTQIREASLYGTAISTIEIPEGVTSIKPYAFKNCVNLVSVDLPSTLTVVDEAAFYACTALRSLDLPDAVTKIGNYTFRKCAALAEVSFGAGLVNIGESSFYGCESLVYLDIPDNATTIQAYAFKGCINLEILNLSDSLTTLGDSAFHTCTGLDEVVIPANVTRVGDYCFSGSSGIDCFTFLGNAPAIGSGAFNKITATAYYPSGNSTWTASVKQNYGGSITWLAN